MNDLSSDPRLSIGANGPPEDESAVDAIRKTIDDHYAEALLWLDGAKVENQAQADALKVLHDALDKASKLAEAERVAAKEPHLAAGRAVDAEFKPLVDKAEKVRKALKLAVQRWNDHLAELQRQEAERVRQAAIDAAATAQRLLDEAHAANNLGRIEEAEQQAAVADELADMAKRAEAARAVTKGAGGRGIGKVPMRWVARLDDAVAALKHYRAKQPEALKAWLADQAAQDVRAGKRVIPGFTITNEKVA